MRPILKYSIKVFSPRWGHDDTWDFYLDGEGWKVQFGTGTHGCRLHCEDSVNDADEIKEDKQFFHWARNDMINVPEVLPRFLRYLCAEYKEGEINEEQIQEELDALAEWINAVTRFRPTSSKFKSYAG